MWLFCPQLLAPSPLLTLLVTLRSWSLHSSSGSLYLWFLLELHSPKYPKGGLIHFLPVSLSCWLSFVAIREQTEQDSSIFTTTTTTFLSPWPRLCFSWYLCPPIFHLPGCLLLVCNLYEDFGLQVQSLMFIRGSEWQITFLCLPSLCSLYALLFAACAHCTLLSLSISSATNFSAMFVPLFTYWTLIFFLDM